MEDFETACSNAEIELLVLKQTDLDAIIDALESRHNDKSADAAAGRVLTNNLLSLKLRKGDRLEPSNAMRDVWSLEEGATISEEGITFVFWRSSAQTLVRVRNPLFSRRSFVIPSSIAADELHCLHLGVFADYVNTVFWACIDEDVFHVKSPTMQRQTCVAAAAEHLKSKLWEWYKQQAKSNPKKPVYKIMDLDPLTIQDKKGRRRLDAKAAQTGTLLNFAHHLCQTYLDKGAIVSGRPLKLAGDWLMRYVEISRRGPLNLPPGDRQALMDCALGYLSRRREAGIPWKPKCHMFIHLCQEAFKFGNPGLTGTWIDEGLNLRLGKCCAGAHAAVWAQRVLAEYNHAAGPAATAAAAGAAKRRRRS